MNWQIAAGFALLVLDVIILIGLDDALQCSLRRPVHTAADWLEWLVAVVLALLLFLGFPGLAIYLLHLGVNPQ